MKILLLFLTSIFLYGGSSFSIAADTKSDSKSQANAIGKKSKEHSLDPVFGSFGKYPKNAVMEVKSYDKKTRTFLVGSTILPAEGEFYVSAESLKRAADSIDLQLILKEPSRIVGTQFMIDQELWFFSSQELDVRRGRPSNSGSGIKEQGTK